MFTSTRLLFASALLGLGALLWFNAPSKPVTAKTETPRTAEPPPVTDYSITGPFTHENLSIFLVRGPDTVANRQVKTLDEALTAKCAIVHEIGEVNTLVVENTSATEDLMIQSGDIVKGGKQDRVIAATTILPPKSGPVAVQSFCVEQGRWTGRTGKTDTQFEANKMQIAGKNLKNAALVQGAQPEVWKEVGIQTAKLSMQTGVVVNDPNSKTSLQLALENDKLQEKLKPYITSLSSALKDRKNVIGYVVVVNGKPTTADVFGSSLLMEKAWSKCLQAAATDALAEKDGKAFTDMNADGVKLFLADASSRNDNVVEGQSETVTRQQEGRSQSGGQRERLAIVGLPAPLPTANPTFMQTGPGSGGQPQPQPVPLETIQQALRNSEPLQFQTQGQPVAQGGQPAQPSVQPTPTLVNRTSGQNGIMVESRDAKQPNVVFHRSFIAK